MVRSHADGSVLEGAHVPGELVYREAVPDRGGAMRREAQIKRQTRSEKLTLIQEFATHEKNGT